MMFSKLTASLSAVLAVSAVFFTNIPPTAARNVPGFGAFHDQFSSTGLGAFCMTGSSISGTVTGNNNQNCPSGVGSTQSIIIPLPSDTAAATTVKFTMKTTTLPPFAKVRCRAMSRLQNGAALSTTAFVENSSVNTIQLVTTTSVNRGTTGYLYANCEVGVGGFLYGIAYDN